MCTRLNLLHPANQLRACKVCLIRNKIMIPTLSQSNIYMVTLYVLDTSDQESVDSLVQLKKKGKSDVQSDFRRQK